MSPLHGIDGRGPLVDAALLLSGVGAGGLIVLTGEHFWQCRHCSSGPLLRLSVDMVLNDFAYFSAFFVVLMEYAV